MPICFRSANVDGTCMGAHTGCMGSYTGCMGAHTGCMHELCLTVFSHFTLTCVVVVFDYILWTVNVHGTCLGGHRACMAVHTACTCTGNGPHRGFTVQIYCYLT